MATTARITAETLAYPTDRFLSGPDLRDRRAAGVVVSVADVNSRVEIHARALPPCDMAPPAASERCNRMAKCTAEWIGARRLCLPAFRFLRQEDEA
jgi:hypothetical protein